MLSLVRQQHNNSCVPAALATISGVTYKTALKVVYPWKKNKGWDNYGTKHNDMLRAIKRLGFRYKERDPVSFSKLRFNAIIIVEHPVYGPHGRRNHAVVWDCEQQRILDPYVHADGVLKRHLLRRTYEKAAFAIIEIR